MRLVSCQPAHAPSNSRYRLWTVHSWPSTNTVIIYSAYPPLSTSCVLGIRVCSCTRHTTNAQPAQCQRRTASSIRTREQRTFIATASAPSVQTTTLVQRSHPLHLHHLLALARYAANELEAHGIDAAGGTRVDLRAQRPPARPSQCDSWVGKIDACLQHYF